MSEKTLKHPRTPIRLLASAAFAAFLLVTHAPSSGDLVTPRGELEAVWIQSGGEPKEYFLVSGEDPARLEVEGPGTLRVYFRAHFPGKSDAPTTVTAALEVPGTATRTAQIEVQRSKSAGYDDQRAGRPSRGAKVEWPVPKGDHTAEVSAVSSTGQPVYAIFYYFRLGDQGKPTATRTFGPFEVTGEFYLGLVYDDNPIHYSDEDIDAFRRGEDPDKFSITTYDDLILNPWASVDLTFPVAGFQKSARLRLKYQWWRYTSNHVKNNESMLLLWRQPVRRLDYIEFSYSYSPEQYIRNFRWRHPYAPRSTTPLVYQPFDYTRNEFVFGYRWRFHPRLAAKGTVRRALKFYNRPFMDNDLWVWAYRIDTEIYVTDRWRMTLRYQLDVADSRGHDTVEENKENSNDSVSDHYVDRYRLILVYRPKRGGYWPQRVGWDVRYELSYFTSDKAPKDDPRHVGRKDKKWVAELTLLYPFLERTSLEIGYRYSTRSVDSPYKEQIIAEEKDYTSNRVWIGFKRPL